MDFNEKTTGPNRVKRNLTIPAVIMLLALFFWLGFNFGQGKISVSSGKVEIKRGEAPSLTADYSLLWEALDLVNTKYVDRPLDQQKLLYGAVSGLVEAIADPYTTFFNPEDAKKFREELKGSFEGIGAEIGIKNDQLIIIAPLEGTPAAKAGLLAGDAILAVDGQSTAALTVDQAVSKIRGKAGTEVTLTIVRKDSREPKEIKITRARIEIKSVKFETKEIDGKKVAVIKLIRFGEDTQGLLEHDVDVLLTGGYGGIVLDLRNNPGGFLDIAVSVASNWVQTGKVVVYEISFNGAEKEYKATKIPRLSGIKTVVLVNEGSASASEIVAGALQDYNLATIVGEKTFGKGSVQEVENLKGDSSIKITTAKWFTPKRRGIDKLGLEPDIKIELTPADAEAGKDPQMDKALELLR